jgi:hypothetical protein
MLVNFTKKELIEINVSVSQNLSKFKDTLKDHEKKSLENIFNKTYKIISKESKELFQKQLRSLNN